MRTHALQGSCSETPELLTFSRQFTRAFLARSVPSWPLSSSGSNSDWVPDCQSQCTELPCHSTFCLGLLVIVPRCFYSELSRFVEGFTSILWPR